MKEGDEPEGRKRIAQYFLGKEFGFYSEYKGNPTGGLHAGEKDRN